jgi:hypothetical protein
MTPNSNGDRDSRQTAAIRSRFDVAHPVGASLKQSINGESQTPQSLVSRGRSAGASGAVVDGSPVASAVPFTKRGQRTRSVRPSPRSGRAARWRRTARSARSDALPDTRGKIVGKSRMTSTSVRCGSHQRRMAEVTGVQGDGVSKAEQFEPEILECFDVLRCDRAGSRAHARLTFCADGRLSRWLLDRPMRCLHLHSPWLPSRETVRRLPGADR